MSLVEHPTAYMKGVFIFCLIFYLFLVLSLRESKGVEGGNNNGVYIVYMGAAASTNGSLRNDRDQLLTSLFKRKQNAIVHTYKHSFSGFAARLSEEEARTIAKNPEVVSVFPDPVLQLHTTRSWDFLKYETSVEIDSTPVSVSDSDSSTQEYDTIIGILDTGIWPESESFSDKNFNRPVPGPPRWKGICMESQDFNSSNCNRKIIGARFYDSDDAATISSHTPRDVIGHGTHMASTAAGRAVAGASYYGLAAGTATGGAPEARIAVYRVCSPEGCRGSAILAAFDNAIDDGVDVLSLSLGSPSMMRPEFSSDPIAIGAFHAVEKGITVVCSAGNDGPTPGSVVNDAPWLLTVAASTIDRDFESDVVLGGNKVIKGEGINFATIQKSPVYPLIHGKSAKKQDANKNDASNCIPNSMDGEQIKGKIVVCDHNDDGYSERNKKDEVKRLGGIGLVLVNDLTRSVASSYGAFPMTVVSSEDAADILSYINSTKNPVATILATVSVTKYKPAPAVAYFSSRGPSASTKSLLKPDILAPGVEILAAWMGNDTGQAPAGKEPPLFNVISGTSMACPHVSGIAATVKSRNPSWSPSAIKSAIMTSATQTNNLKAPIRADSGSIATPYDYGTGEVSTSGPLQPGLVYETSTMDYLNFLCYHGYDVSTIKTIAKDVPDGFACPHDSGDDYISNINYPSIAIANFEAKGSKNVSRTVTNVGGDEKTTYSVSVDAPSGVTVAVSPDKLQFTKNGEKLRYQVTFTSSASSVKDDAFGSITWTNGKYKVRSPFVLRTTK